MTSEFAVNILLDAAVKSVVVLVMAGVMMACMRKRSAAARHLLCFLAVASLPVLPVLSWALPGWRVLPGWLDFRGTKPVIVKQPAKPYLTAETSVGIPPTPNRIEIAAPVTPEIVPQENVPSPAIQNSVVPKPPPGRAKIYLWRTAYFAWLAGVLLALVPVVLGMFSLHRLGRKSRRETAASWLELLRHMLLRLGFKRRVVLLKTVRRRMPMTWGILHPKVLLPEESNQWPEDRRSAVLLHELAHAQRWDYLTHLITRLVCALYWFNPLVWLAARWMIAERERACDDIVLRHGAEPADYAEQVLEISAGLSLGWFAGYNGVAMARASNLEGRLRAILDRHRNRAAVTRAAVGGAIVLLTAIIVPVAMMKAAPNPQSANPQSAASNLQTNKSLVTTAAAPIPPLERRVSISAEQKPLKDVLAEICRQAGVELELDADGLKMSGVSIDTPVTLKCQDEPLQWAVARVLRLLQRQVIPDIVQDTSSGKLVVTSIKALTERETKAQPAWLNGYGYVVKIEDQTNAVSISIGEKADDELLAKLKTLAKLRELEIEATKTITPQGLAHLAELPALEKLKLYAVNEGDDRLGDAALKAAAQIQTLRDISVEESGVTDDGARALEGMSQLTALSLRGNSLTDAGLKYLAGLTNLQQLDLSQTMWVRSHMEITDEGLANLSNLTKLQSLSIGGLGKVTDVGLKHLSRLTELRNLTFAGSAVTSQNISFSHLQSLDFSGSQVTDATLDNIGQYHELQRLSLRYTSVTDAGLARIAGLTELRQLSLDSRVITDTGIAQLRALPKLEYLWLRATEVSDASLRSLAEIKSLTRLDLFGSGQPGVNVGHLFTMDGLSQLNKLPNLRVLWINNLELPDGYLRLREFKQLSGLTLDFCNVKDAEEELLQAAMPDTSVSASSGKLKTIVSNQPVQPVTLPDVSVRVTGFAVDDASGQPVRDCKLEFGADNPDKPGELIWGESLPGGRMEVAGNDFRNTSRFWGESFRPGKVWARLLASGYQPALLTPHPVTAPLQMTNLVVRLKRGGDFHGIVLDYKGNPVPGMRVYLADKPNFYLRDGVENWLNRTGYSATDANGHFTLSGGNGTPQKLVVSSADGHMFHVLPDADSSRDLKVTLPQPATLVLHYDIPDDLPVAECILNFNSQKLDPAMWKDTSFGFDPVVTNRSEIVLTNLTPGNYELLRRKILHVGTGSRFQFLDDTNLVLKGGETQRVDVVRPVGQTVRGQVTGIEEASALGAYIYACSGEITNSPIKSWNPGPLIDLGTCGKDGVFQMARFPPGTYSIVAMAYKEPDVYSHSMDADFIGVAKVTVTADAPPQAVKIELHPRVDSAKSP
jgi:beta-lactamase regulating signal transducer with metallopeptidase domain/Leucine-rich repeat (LRR) protein